jgi:hypothetical protein
MTDRDRETWPPGAHPDDETLSAELDGDLEPQRAEALRAHLAECATCRDRRAQLAAVVAGLAELGRVEPERDLWPAIAAGRPAPRRGWRERLRRWWLAPAAAAVGAAAALLLVWWLGGPAAPEGGGPAGPGRALAEVQQAEQTYARAIASLESALAEQQPMADPAVRRTIEQGLAEIDQTLERCRRALRRRPHDLAAHQTLLAAYQHKVDFLTELVGESL